jgi:outer membrane protein TolC
MINKNLHMIFFMLMVFNFVFYLHPVYAEEPLTMEKSIDVALKNSITLDIAKEGLKGATAQKREAITGFLPKFNTSYTYTRLSEAPFSRFVGLSSAPPPLNFFDNKEFVAGTVDNYNWSIEVRQPLFAGGGILANYQASSIGEDAARMDETAKTQDVVLEVKIAYYNILRAQRIQTAALQSVEMLKAHRDVAENYFRVGMIPKNDLLHAEVELANGKQALVRAQNMVELSKSHFNTVLKRQISASVEVEDILTYQPLLRSFEECLNIARQMRPELKIASLKASQAGKLVKIAQSDYFPSLSFVGNYTRFGDNPSVSGSDYKDMENWYLMAVASWNFWEWGKTKFRVDASKAKENQATGAAKELNDQISLEIKDAYLTLQEAENQIIVSQKVIEQAEENFRISEERYKERMATSTEVLEAQTLLTRAKSEYANALGDYNINYAKLQKSMGIIWGTGKGNLKTDDGNVKAEEGILKTNESNSKTGEENIKRDEEKIKVTEHAVSSTVTEKSASVSREQSATKSIPERDVRNLVNKWLTSWQSGDMKIYRACYASDFRSKGKDLNAWISHKSRVHQKNKKISIRIESLRISTDAKASTAEAIFTQYYSSSILKEAAKKKLMLRKVNGEWKIYKETIARLR